MAAKQINLINPTTDAEFLNNMFQELTVELKHIKEHTCKLEAKINELRYCKHKV